VERRPAERGTQTGRARKRDRQDAERSLAGDGASLYREVVLSLLVLLAGSVGPLVTGRDLTDGTDFWMGVLRACGEWAREGIAGRA
jgi:hypothetical protein